MIHPCERKFWFTPWVYGCLSGGNLILLDIKRDRYLLFNRDETASLLYFTRHKLINTTEPDNINILDIKSNIDNLLQAGIITDNPHDGVWLTSANIQTPECSFEILECDDWPKITTLDVVNGFISGLRAYIYLRFLSLNSIINEIRKYNINNIAQRSEILRISRIYQRIRPILPKNKVCLYDTLSFIYFCRFYKIKPSVVFGVTSDPFQAHCWAQLDGIIANDVPQKIKQYTPIMEI